MINDNQDEKAYTSIYLAFFAGFILATIIFGIVFLYTLRK